MGVTGLRTTRETHQTDCTARRSVACRGRSQSRERVSVGVVGDVTARTATKMVKRLDLAH